MNPLNLFTSNSDAPNGRSLADSIHVLAWVVISLVMIDVFINTVFAFPSDPKITNPSRLRLYFDYGRSTEGKLARMTRDDPSQTAPITLSGWYEPLQVIEAPTAPEKPIVTIYGMSHAVRLAEALTRTSDRFSSRSVGAPGATTNWSYGAYLRDRGGGKSRAVVLALMSVSLPVITAMSPLTYNYDFAEPYTSDRFYLDGGQLRVAQPPFASFKEYVQAFDDPKRWAAARDVFARYDPSYNRLLFRTNICDHSSLCRLIRRAYAQRVSRDQRRNVLDANGFRPESEQVRVANEIVHNFAQEAKSDKLLPVIFIVNNFGYSDFMYQAIRPTLDADKIPFLSSHTIVSPSDPRGYLPDGHFTDENDDRLAAALVEVIENGK
jgi:hypothetical protein